jgi:hypothetical protein
MCWFRMWLIVGCQCVAVKCVDHIWHAEVRSFCSRGESKFCLMLLWFWASVDAAAAVIAACYVPDAVTAAAAVSVLAI